MIQQNATWVPTIKGKVDFRVRKGRWIVSRGRWHQKKKVDRHTPRKKIAAPFPGFSHTKNITFTSGKHQAVHDDLLTNFGPVAIMLCSQQAGQGTSERMHQVTKQVRTKTRNKQSGVVGATYTEIKMGILQQRATDVNAKKIIKRTDKVSVLGLV